MEAIGWTVVWAALGAALGWIAHAALHKHGLSKLEAFWQERQGRQAGRLMAARQRLAATELKLEKIQRELALSTDLSSRLEQALERREAEVERLEAERAARTAELERVARAVRAAEAERFALVAGQREPAPIRSEAAPAPLGPRPVRLTQAREATDPPVARGADRPRPEAPTAARDDLTRIRGIGRSLERWLNRRGVFTYRQIAGWDEEQVKRLSEELRVFPGRIENDRWIQGAKDAHRRKYGESL